MSSKSGKSQENLMAIYRLDFYKKQNRWKLAKTEEKTEAKADCEALTMAAVEKAKIDPKPILNKTYMVEFPKCDLFNDTASVCSLVDLKQNVDNTGSDDSESCAVNLQAAHREGSRSEESWCWSADSTEFQEGCHRVLHSSLKELTLSDVSEIPVLHPTQGSSSKMTDDVHLLRYLDKAAPQGHVGASSTKHVTWHLNPERGSETFENFTPYIGGVRLPCGENDPILAGSFIFEAQGARGRGLSKGVIGIYMGRPYRL